MLQSQELQKILNLSNNTDAPVYIEGYTSGGMLYFNIFGEETRPSDRKVSYVSETISQTDPGVSLRADGSHPVGYVAQVQSAHTGYTAKLWKVVIRKWCGRKPDRVQQQPL